MKTKTKVLNRFVKWKTAALAALAVAALASTPALAGDNDNDGDDFKFDLVPSKGLPAAALNGALKDAHGRVKIESVGPVEIMDVTVWGLPPNTDFDFFVIQVPNKPFGLAVSASRPSSFHWRAFRLRSCSITRFRMLRWVP
jgi:hypothetical protein